MVVWLKWVLEDTAGWCSVELEDELNALLGVMGMGMGVPVLVVLHLPTAPRWVLGVEKVAHDNSSPMVAGGAWVVIGGASVEVGVASI